MSKCPLQIYLNDRYLDSCASVAPGNIFKKTFNKGGYDPERSIYEKKFDRPRIILENEKNKITTHNQSFTKFGSKSILGEYLNRHSKSIEAYHSLQKQQEEVLKLCKQKLAQRFPKAVLKDEDIITALRIAQNSNCHLDCKSGNQITRAVLNIILSKEDNTVNAEHSKLSKNGDGNNSDAWKRNQKCHPELSFSEYFNSKKKRVVNKLVNLFTKPAVHRAYFTSSDNYFNNSQFIVNTSNMGLVRYPAITENGNSSTIETRKRKLKNFMHKFGETSHMSGKHGDGRIISNSSFTTTNKEFRKKKKKLLSYYCTYQRDVDILKVEIKRQKHEIKVIQKNLNLCLKILKSLEDKNTKDNFLKFESQNFHVFTPSTRGFHNPAEPYNQSYQQFKAEMDCHGSCCTETTQDTVSVTSSSDRRNQCCTCFQKKPKKPKKEKPKRKKKAKKKPSKQKSSKQIVCKCPSAVHTILSPPAVRPSEPQTTWEPPAECCCKSKRKDPEHVLFGKGVQVIDATQEMKDGFNDANSDTESMTSSTSTDSKKKKKKGKKQKKPKKTKSKKKMKKPEEKPKRKSCCIRLLKIMCCGSACV